MWHLGLTDTLSFVSGSVLYLLREVVKLGTSETSGRVRILLVVGWGMRVLGAMVAALCV